MAFCDELDVSDALITAAVHMYDADRVVYLPWERCTMRSMEVVGVPKDERFEKDKDGFMKAASVQQEGDADLSTGLHVDFALKRRGLAFEMADVMSWEAHAKRSARTSWQPSCVRRHLDTLR